MELDIKEVVTFILDGIRDGDFKLEGYGTQRNRYVVMDNNNRPLPSTTGVMVITVDIANMLKLTQEGADE